MHSACSGLSLQGVGLVPQCLSGSDPPIRVAGSRLRAHATMDAKEQAEARMRAGQLQERDQQVRQGDKPGKFKGPDCFPLRGIVSFWGASVLFRFVL